MEYPACFGPAQAGGFVITFPDFDWGITKGDSEAQALDMAPDALIMMIQEHIRKGERLPPPDPVAQSHVPDHSLTRPASHES